MIYSWLKKMDRKKVQTVWTLWVHHFPMNSHNFLFFIHLPISVQVAQVATHFEWLVIVAVRSVFAVALASSSILLFSSYICVSLWMSCAVKKHSKQNLPNCWNRSINNTYAHKIQRQNRRHHFNHHHRHHHCHCHSHYRQPQSLRNVQYNE